MMPKLLSDDLRLRVVRAIDDGMSRRQAAARVEVVGLTADPPVDETEPVDREPEPAALVLEPVPGIYVQAEMDREDVRTNLGFVRVYASGACGLSCPSNLIKAPGRRSARSES